MALIQYDLAVGARVYHKCKDLAIAHDGASRQEVIQSEQVGLHDTSFICDFQAPIKAVQTWSGQFTRDLKGDLSTEELVNLLVAGSDR